MLGCWNRATASASARNRPDRPGHGVVPGLDHLEGDQPIERELPGLVHHAHPAPAQLAEDPVAGNLRAPATIAGPPSSRSTRPPDEPARLRRPRRSMSTRWSASWRRRRLGEPREPPGELLEAGDFAHRLAEHEFAVNDLESRSHSPSGRAGWSARYASAGMRRPARQPRIWSEHSHSTSWASLACSARVIRSRRSSPRPEKLGRSDSVGPSEVHRAIPVQVVQGRVRACHRRVTIRKGHGRGRGSIVNIAVKWPIGHGRRFSTSD